MTGSCQEIITGQEGKKRTWQLDSCKQPWFWVSGFDLLSRNTCL